MNRDAALEYLWNRIDYERALVVPYNDWDYKLQRMRDLLDRLGRPQDRLPIVHVAGTKGKGSTSAMIAAILTASGRRTGLFTSPHLQSIEERFQIDGVPCPGDELGELVGRIRPVLAEMDAIARRAEHEIGPTFFEVTTALALMHFERAQVDAAVLEVGLGGRLDSTNVCEPRVSVITSISYDHMKQLGNTLTEIAGEKAGIIKPGVPVISGVTNEEARVVIQRRSDEHGCHCVQLGREFTFDYAPAESVDVHEASPTIDFRAQSGHFQRLDRVALGLLGRHQGANAAVALATVNELIRQHWQIDESAVRRGLAQVRWPARIELLARRPTVVLDAAHNVASIAALLETLAESFRPRQRVLIFASTRDKDLTGMLKLLVPAFDRIVLTQYTQNPRRIEPAELLATARQVVEPRLVDERCTTATSPEQAWQLARESARPDDLICVTGSFFIAAEMKALITR